MRRVLNRTMDGSSTGHETLVDFPTTNNEVSFASPLPTTGSEVRRDALGIEVCLANVDRVYKADTPLYQRSCLGSAISDPSGNQPPVPAMAAPAPEYPRILQLAVRDLESHLSPSPCHKQGKSENDSVHDHNKVPISHESMPPRSRTPPLCPPPPPPSPIGHTDDVTHLVQPPPPQFGGGIDNAA